MTQVLDKIDHKTHIIIKGARVHNLKNIDLAIPKNKLVVITGVSGSGKSSLAFDTLYAEGQRRYVESLSSYARQFLGKLEKPDVDGIRGIAPAIAIEQKVISRNPRSTVGTTTEIYDYLKLLFARVGKIYSPISGQEIKKDTPEDILKFILGFPKDTQVLLLCNSLPPKGRAIKQQLSLLQDQGFSRIVVDGKILKISEVDASNIKSDSIILVIDRFSANDDGDNVSRIMDSVQTAFLEGKGYCELQIDGKNYSFSNSLEKDGIQFEEPTTHLFSSNSPLGACPTCEGFGSVLGIDADLVIPNKNLSIYEDAIVCWKGESFLEWKKQLIDNALKFDFPIHRPYKDLTTKQKELLWTGNKYFEGLHAFFKWVETQLYKVQYRVMLSRYRGKTVCPTCKGKKLRKEADYVKINGHTFSDVASLSIDKASELISSLTLNDYEKPIAERLLLEVKNRLKFLQEVGLGYLTLDRLSNTLSGGESQRINLATSIGSSLVGSLYVLDEPSIGLHPRDTHRLIKVLKSLRDLGNTVVVVEHDEEIMKAADEIIDIGPMAGTFGGEVVFQGVHDDLMLSQNSLTAKYLTGREEIFVPEKRRKWHSFVTIEGARENNLKDIDVKIPLGVLTVVTGVSGSGKSTLIKKILVPYIKRQLDGYIDKPGDFNTISGDVEKIKSLEFIDQNPIGKSSRSNPVTYVKAFDEIRKLFASQQASKVNGFQAKHFSFNVEGGRCETCQGDGTITVEMQFMADVHLKCDECNGKRFKDEVLEVNYLDKNIYDILEMTVDDAIEFFSANNSTTERKIVERLKPLSDVGLGYVRLGQPSSTLSGGEAQRIKLASFLNDEKQTAHTLFVFDEPSTGLHFHDVKKLLFALNALIEKGHSVLVIEHHGDIIKSADWIIDLGLEGGENGGNLLFEGIPEDLIKNKSSYTGKFLKEKL
ncbi:MAG: excinuclease ABC subunit UvrA [Bacteroidia bacterium]